jgi:hypothetical protein
MPAKTSRIQKSEASIWERRMHPRGALLKATKVMAANSAATNQVRNLFFMALFMLRKV